MPRSEDIAVVVPALQEAQGIAGLVTALRDGGFAEVVVVDGGSSDRTPDLAAGAGATVLTAPPGRASQMNAGAARTRGDVLLFLHADARLPGDAAALILRALHDPSVAAGCLRLRFDEAHPLLDLYAWCSRFESFATTFGDQAFFVRRSAFDAVGGVPQQPLMEDVEFRRRLRRVGRFVKLKATVVTSARRFRRNGMVRQQLLNATLLAAYLMGVPARRLARFYR